MWSNVRLAACWADPDLAAGQKLSSSNLIYMVLEAHTEEVESWAAEKLPAEVQISKDLSYPEADKPWDKKPLQQLDTNSKNILHTIIPIEESTIKRDIASALSGASLRIAGIARESLPEDHDFFSTEDLEYLCAFYEQGIKDVAKALKRSISSVERKYRWLERLNLVDYYKERFLQKEKAPAKAEGQRKISSTL